MKNDENELGSNTPKKEFSDAINPEESIEITSMTHTKKEIENDDNIKGKNSDDDDSDEIEFVGEQASVKNSTKDNNNNNNDDDDEIEIVEEHKSKRKDRDFDDDAEISIVRPAKKNKGNDLNSKDTSFDELEITKKQKHEPTDSPKVTPQSTSTSTSSSKAKETFTDPNVIPSPIRLIQSSDLPASHNVDTVSLASILNQKDMRYMWQFNCVFDANYFMKLIDSSIRENLWTSIITGKCKNPSFGAGLTYIKTQIWENFPPLTLRRISLDGVWLNPYTSHHTKMMILGFVNESKPISDTRNHREIDSIQIVIQTANMIEMDWEHMTQMVWISPRLPRISLKPETYMNSDSNGMDTYSEIGNNFKNELLEYIHAYKLKVTDRLYSEVLAHFDFSSIRAKLIKSIPEYTPVYGNTLSREQPEQHKRVGLDDLQGKVASVPQDKEDWSKDKIILQCSSIGVMDETQGYFRGTISRACLGLDLLSSNRAESVSDKDMDKIEVIWPTVNDVRNSTVGYLSGTSIFMQTTGSAKQIAQQEYMKKYFRKWEAFKAGRMRSMPHLKTYIRTNEERDRIRWALTASHNMSRQAWGVITRRNHQQVKVQIRPQNWELGVFIYPDLFLADYEDTDEEDGVEEEDKKGKGKRKKRIIKKQEKEEEEEKEEGEKQNRYNRDKNRIVMVPVYKRDRLSDEEARQYRQKHKLDADSLLVCLRMGYDLNTQKYNWDWGDIPWSSDVKLKTYEKDCLGQSWPPVI